MAAQLRMKVARLSQEGSFVPLWLVSAKLEGLQSQGAHLVKVSVLFKLMASMQGLPAVPVDTFKQRIFALLLV